MGRVLQVRDLVGGRRLALKILELPGGVTERGMLHFQQEFTALTRLRHPNVPQVFDFGQLADGKPYFTMELVEGQDLSKLLPLAPARYFSIFIQLAQALSFVHSRRVVHRDIKASNVRVQFADSGSVERVILLDFGLVSPFDNAQAGRISGTLSHLPPEAFHGGGRSVRGDLYSLGVLMFQGLTGQLPRPARASGTTSIRAATTLVDLSPISGSPAPLVRLIRSLLAASPALRPSSADAVVEVLARLSGTPALDLSREQKRSFLATPALVGRGQQLRRLREVEASASGEALEVALISGVAGEGKSRLIDEFVLDAQVGGARVLRAACRPDTRVPFAPVLEAMMPLIYEDEGRAGEVMREVAPTVVRISERLREHFPEVEPAPPLEDRDAEVVRLVDALERWLLAATERGVVVFCLDDLHWADGLTQDLLDRLVSRRGGAHKLAVVGALRNDELDASSPLRRLLRENPDIELQLGPFDSYGIKELIRKQFAVETTPDALVRVLLSETGGNPFFVHEVLRYLVEDGQIRHRRGHWRLPERLDAVRLPAELSGLVTARLDRCSEDAREVAELLALAGRPLEPLILQRLLGERPLAEPLRDLIDQDLVGQDEAAVQLRHAFMVDWLRAELDDARAREMHLLLAQRMSEAREESPGAFNEAEIGRHFQLAGDDARALPLLLSAGDRAFDVQAQEEAIRIFSWADEILQRMPYLPGGQLDQVEAKLVRLQFYVDPASCITSAERMIQRMKEQGWLERVPSMRRWLGSAAVTVAALVSVRQISREVDQFDVDRFREFYGTYVVTTALKAVAMAWTGRFASAEAFAQKQLFPLVPGKDSPMAAVAEASLCVVLPLQGRTREIQERLERARRILEGPKAEELGRFDRHISLYGAVYTSLAAHEAIRGLPDALRHVRPDEAPDFTTLSVEAAKTIAVSNFHGQRGEMAQLEQELRRLRQLRVRLRPQTVEMVNRGLVWGCIESGDFARARELLAQMNHMGDISEAQGALFGARCPGDVEERLTAIATCRRICATDEARSPLMLQIADWVEAEILLEARRYAPALGRARAAIAAAREPDYRNEYNELRGLEAAALAELGLGHLDAAEALAREALQLALRTENPIRVGAARMALARVMGEKGSPEAEEQLAESVADFERLGNSHQVRRALRLRGAIVRGEGRGVGVDPHALSADDVAQLTWSVELGDVVEGALRVLGAAVPGSERWIVVFETPDSSELRLGQAGDGGVPGEEPSRELLREARRVERSDASWIELREHGMWVYPLSRPAPPGGGVVEGGVFGLALVHPSEELGTTITRLRELGPRVRMLSGFVANALEHARLSQREYRLSMLTQLGQLLATVRSRDELVSQVLDRMIDVTGADRAAMMLLDERSGALRLELARDADRNLIRPLAEPHAMPLVEKALEITTLVRESRQPPLLASTGALTCEVLALPLRSLLRELEGQPMEIQRRQETLMSLTAADLSTLAQSDTPGTAVGLVYLETDERPGVVTHIDEPLMTLLAGQAGFAIDVARLDRQLVEEVREQEALKAQRKQIERYLSADIAAAVLADPDLVSLGAKKAEVTMLFTDVRGFTAWSGNQPSQVVVDTLNEIFSLVTPIIFKHGGTLDKYLGDGLMAIFGAPVEVRDHARRAAVAAREIQEAISAWLQGQAEMGRRVPGTGIGIHTGQVSVGNIGSEERMEYTAVGDVVNVCSRICALAGPGQVLVSEETAQALPLGAFDIRRLGPTRIKGKEHPIQLFEVQ
ncbi:MAG: AAA family ATPase [Alphaproteobacteria bacterium]|nr:AAA family ATPase [Alphaproteobacteria bacterium]MCB9794491.1 AAA family ATPase [Alphaproteobacteria bacterium]